MISSASYLTPWMGGYKLNSSFSLSVMVMGKGLWDLGVDV